MLEQQNMAVVEYRNFEAPWLHLKPCHLNKFSSKYIETESDAGCWDGVGVLCESFEKRIV